MQISKKISALLNNGSLMTIISIMLLISLGIVAAIIAK